MNVNFKQVLFMVQDTSDDEKLYFVYFIVIEPVILNSEINYNNALFGNPSSIIDTKHNINVRQ